MRDVLGYSVAALIGLWTATLQAWSTQWWAGVIIASAIALITSLHLLWNNLPAPTRGAIRPVFWKPTGYLRAWVGILLLCVLLGGGFVSSHWPTTFLRTQSPVNADAPPELSEPIASRLDHFIMRCDRPVPPGKTVEQSLAELNEFKQKLDIMGDALGLSFSMITIRGGVRLDIEVVSDEAKQRLGPLSSLGVTKLTMEVRRIGQVEIVSVFVKMPPQMAFYGWIPPNPKAPDTIAMVHRIEDFLGARHGICHII
jgi:hypothetical protein